jgi:crotonobetainyl-CoA:carnitine CoA-transferase CaiB-like acyl-CoA transferase
MSTVRTHREPPDRSEARQVTRLPRRFEGAKRPQIEPSLPLGGSNAQVFGEWLGHSPEELAAFKAAGVIS